ncbi:AMER3 protein, partial [Certhia brachydactyla]|nr:AMER3 protein [Certhia brachydactyla]
MELKRGKTFIKASVQHEKVRPAYTAPINKDEIGKDKKATLEGNQSVAEVQLACLATHKNYRFSTRAARNGAVGHNLEKSSGSSYKLVRKSKTHDCVAEADKTEYGSPSSRVCEEGFFGKGKGRLVNSISFSGMSSSSSKKECVVSPSQSACSSQMIDYRNFVPQMPFVPAVAKTIPRKRISLKRSKKGLRDIFHIRKNKPDSLSFLMEKGKNLSSPGCKSELSGRLAKYLFKTAETCAADCLSQDCSDSELQSDSSYDYCNALCEDVASLKSFDSLTGCGEIFADESSAHLELENTKDLLRRGKHKDSPGMGSFQGGVEQLASPGQNETVDFAKFWDNINKSVRLHQSALFEKKLLKIPGSDTEKDRNRAAVSVTDPQVSPDKEGDNSKDSSTETETPKSENQESTSTSDEGYYDSFSPGQEDELKEAQTPGVRGRFPRDSYSGDALYELFYDPNEVKANPILDDDLCASESVSEQAIEIPLSIYSFHVGAEENMASQPTLDIISQGFFHSTWKGKECLLKLCDTELSLTMGIINWLRKQSGLISSPDSLQSPQSQPEKINDSLILPSHSPEQKGDTETHQETPAKGESNTFNICVLLEESKHTTQAPSVNIGGRDQSLDSCLNTSDLDFQGREGSHHKDLSTVPGTVETTRSSSYAPQSRANRDNLQTSSTENEKAAISLGCETSRDKNSVPEKLSKKSGSQSSENPLLDDNHEVESCYSYKTAATSLRDPLEREDKNKPMYHSLSISCDKPLQPLTLNHFHVSPTPTESSANIVQLLEHCVTQVASLKISYENKHLEDKHIGNEMNSIIHKMSQYKKKLLLQNECSCIAQIPEYPSMPSTNQYNYETSFQSKGLYNLKQNGEQICSEDQKSRAKVLDEVTQSKINFEYAQLNSHALSYLKDFGLSPSDSGPETSLSRPTFLPLFSSVCPDVAGTFSQGVHSTAVCLSDSLQPEEAKHCSPGPWNCAESPCHGLAAGIALSPLLEAVARDTAVTARNH